VVHHGVGILMAGWAHAAKTARFGIRFMGAEYVGEEGFF